MMNEAYQAHDGLPPELFPPSIPTYTGGRLLEVWLVLRRLPGAAAWGGGLGLQAGQLVLNQCLCCDASQPACMICACLNTPCLPCLPSHARLQATTTSHTRWQARESRSSARRIRVGGWEVSFASLIHSTAIPHSHLHC